MMTIADKKKNEVNDRALLRPQYVLDGVYYFLSWS